jgi:hypothetical protein
VLSILPLRSYESVRARYYAHPTFYPRSNPRHQHRPTISAAGGESLSSE